jgi:hypothetical protein
MVFDRHIMFEMDENIEHIYKKSRHVILIGILLISAFLLSTHDGKGPMLGDLDIVMFRAINQHMQSPVLNSVAEMASNLGSSDARVLKYILLLNASIFFVSIITN